MQFFYIIIYNNDDIIHINLPASQLTSQIRSYIEYLIQTYNILMLILYSKLMKNLLSVTVSNTI